MPRCLCCCISFPRHYGYILRECGSHLWSKYEDHSSAAIRLTAKLKLSTDCTSTFAHIPHTPVSWPCGDRLPSVAIIADGQAHQFIRRIGIVEMDHNLCRRRVFNRISQR